MNKKAEKAEQTKRLVKQFESEGVLRPRARQLAKIWMRMSPAQRAEVLKNETA